VSVRSERVPDRQDGRRVAEPLEVPHDEVEEVNRLLQDPGTDPGRVVPPLARPRAVGKAEEADERVERAAELAGIQEAPDRPPLGREAELVADRQDAAAVPRGGQQAIAALDGGCHGFLE
jgi:hypothetical protein